MHPQRYQAHAHQQAQQAHAKADQREQGQQHAEHAGDPDTVTCRQPGVEPLHAGPHHPQARPHVGPWQLLGKGQDSLHG